jgi:hypothetical protein
MKVGLEEIVNLLPQSEGDETPDAEKVEIAVEDFVERFP